MGESQGSWPKVWDTKRFYLPRTKEDRVRNFLLWFCWEIFFTGSCVWVTWSPVDGAI